MIGDITQQTDTLTFDQLVTLPENADRHFERIDGRITEKMVSGPASSRLTGRFTAFLAPHIVLNDLGEITTADGGYWVGEDRYIPDIAYVSKARLGAGVQAGYLMVAPDLAVEVLSTTDTTDDTVIKVANYLAAGTVVWLIDPKEQTVRVFEPGKAVGRYTRTMTLTGGSVLPAFSLDLALLFRVAAGETTDESAS